MKTIAVISQKGGAGKTTIALNLAVAAEVNDLPSVVIDLDPQASAKGWHDSREDETPIIISVQASRLDDALQVARDNGAAFTVIDTAPHSESTALAAARAASVVLIPCRPGILDLRAIAASVDICQLAKTPAYAVINAAPHQGALAKEAMDAIKSYGIEIAPVHLGQRMSYVHSLTAGKGVVEYEPNGKAAQEIKSLYTWACSDV